MKLPLPRNLLWIAPALLTGAAMFLAALKGLEFVESTPFCGTTCHVMEPERVAHQHSPHAKVDCGTCHIGPGVLHMVQSKVESARETWNFVFKTYPRPIGTPIRRLRPARTICEQCHWPDKYYGDKIVTKTHVAADEKNTPEWIRLTMKTGGPENPGREGKGIHWHIRQEIDYVATDEKRQTIPWVRVKTAEGPVTFKSEGSDEAEKLASDPKRLRRMDCLDCHNRATHVFRHPDDLLDAAFRHGDLPSDLPYLKREASRILTRFYDQKKEFPGALMELPAYYREHHAKLYTKRRDEIEALPAKLLPLLQQTQFPEMRANWTTHLDNIGHTRQGNGCFRCHDGKHADGGGRTIPQDCNLCHSNLQFGTGKPPQAMPVTMALKGSTHQGLDCDACHGGTRRDKKPGLRGLWPDREACLACHDAGDHPPGAPMAALSCGECHRLHPASPQSTSCLDCHRDVPGKGQHPLHLGMGLTCRKCHPSHSFRTSPQRFKTRCGDCHDGVNPPEYLSKFAGSGS